MSYGYPTTRRHPRSLASAFPREHANPIEIHRRPTRIYAVLMAVVLGVVLALLLVHHLAK